MERNSLGVESNEVSSICLLYRWLSSKLVTIINYLLNENYTIELSCFNFYSCKLEFICLGVFFMYLPRDSPKATEAPMRSQNMRCRRIQNQSSYWHGSGLRPPGRSTVAAPSVTPKPRRWDKQLKSPLRVNSHYVVDAVIEDTLPHHKGFSWHFH